MRRSIVGSFLIFNRNWSTHHGDAVRCSKVTWQQEKTGQQPLDCIFYLVSSFSYRVFLRRPQSKRPTRLDPFIHRFLHSFICSPFVLLIESSACPHFGSVLHFLFCPFRSGYFFFCFFGVNCRCRSAPPLPRPFSF